MEKPTQEEGLKIFWGCIQKSLNRNTLRRIIDGVHILHDATVTLQRTFDAPEQQAMIDCLKRIVIAAEQKQIEAYGPRETWVNQ